MDLNSVKLELQLPSDILEALKGSNNIIHLPPGAYTNDLVITTPNDIVGLDTYINNLTILHDNSRGTSNILIKDINVKNTITVKGSFKLTLHLINVRFNSLDISDAIVYISTPQLLLHNQLNIYSSFVTLTGDVMLLNNDIFLNISKSSVYYTGNLQVTNQNIPGVILFYLDSSNLYLNNSAIVINDFYKGVQSTSYILSIPVGPSEVILNNSSITLQYFHPDSNMEWELGYNKSNSRLFVFNSTISDNINYTTFKEVRESNYEIDENEQVVIVYEGNNIELGKGTNGKFKFIRNLTDNLLNIVGYGTIRKYDTAVFYYYNNKWIYIGRLLF